MAIDEADRETSRRALINRLFMGGLLPYRVDMQYTDHELFAALAGILLPIIGTDALYAAREVLRPAEESA